MMNKIKRTVINTDTYDNLSPTQEAEVMQQCIAAGVPEQLAKAVRYHHKVTIKTVADLVFIQARYLYPGGWSGNSCRRLFIAKGKLIAEVDGGRSNCWNEYETQGRGHLEALDEDYYWDNLDGVRDFDKVAHQILREVARGCSYELQLLGGGWVLAVNEEVQA